MFSFSLPQLLTLASLLTGGVASAQPTLLKRAAPRTVVITGQTGKPHDIRVAHGFLTTLLLDAPIERLAVILSGARARTLLSPLPYTTGRPGAADGAPTPLIECS